MASRGWVTTRIPCSARPARVRWSGVQRAKRWTSSAWTAWPGWRKRRPGCTRAAPAAARSPQIRKRAALQPPAAMSSRESSPELGAFEVDDRRPNLAREAFFGLGVEGRPGNRGGRPGRQERPGPDEILVHAAIMAWTSANWVAQRVPCAFGKGAQKPRSDKAVDTATRKSPASLLTARGMLGPVRTIDLPPRVYCLAWLPKTRVRERLRASPTPGPCAPRLNGHGSQA